MTTCSRRALLRSAAAGTALAIQPDWLRPLSDRAARSKPAHAANRYPDRAARRTAAQPLLDYFRTTAPQLLRPPQGPLQHPSIAPSLPGKEYSAELWDWDTLWTTRGLFAYAKAAREADLHDSDLHDRIAEHARGSLLNFLDHQAPSGRIPLMISAAHPDGGPLASLARREQNQAKPVMAQLALLIADETGSADWLRPHFDRLLRFHDSWISNNQSSTGLLVWGDDVAIGNDNDPTTFGRPFFSSANLLLNCLFYQDLLAAKTLSERLARPQQEQQRLATQADQLAHAMRTQCWDPRDSFYYTVDVQCTDKRAELIPDIPRGMSMSWSSLPLRIQVFTGFLPLWCGLATPDQAHALIRTNYLADDRFRAAYGVRSLANRETMYSLVFSSNPSNWLGPAWIIVNYFVWKGLAQYGFTAEAEELADKTVHLLTASLAQDGSLNEYYHPDTGAGLSHKGFMDWNLLVIEML